MALYMNPNVVKVQEAYPGAICTQTNTGCHIVHDKKVIGSGGTYIIAWEDAAKTIKPKHLWIESISHDVCQDCGGPIYTGEAVVKTGIALQGPLCSVCGVRLAKCAPPIGPFLPAWVKTTNL